MTIPDEEIQKMVCSECRSGVLRQHHEMPDQYLKCGLCGFTKATARPSKGLDSSYLFVAKLTLWLEKS